MIDKNKITTIVEAYLAENQREDLFLIEVKVSKTNVISVVLDGDNGIKVDDCISISRFIESKMDRDKEDFELTVTSFGLGEYFVLPRQFKKNVNQTVEVLNTDDEKTEGILSEVTSEDILITTKKDKNGTRIPFAEIKKARIIIKF
ncbi:MAG: ribosome assembly cofactor RimP [Bacteroidales bacterium]|nr:ribosome assembly cofactor RimP [Bacteroidales bacterium]